MRTGLPEASNLHATADFVDESESSLVAVVPGLCKEYILHAAETLELSFKSLTGWPVNADLMSHPICSGIRLEPSCTQWIH